VMFYDELLKSTDPREGKAWNWIAAGRWSPVRIPQTSCLAISNPDLYAAREDFKMTPA